MNTSRLLPLLQCLQCGSKGGEVLADVSSHVMRQVMGRPQLCMG